MPNKLINQLIRDVASLDEKLEQHLIEGTGVKNDLAWIKKIQWLTITASVTTAGSAIIALFVYFLGK